MNRACASVAASGGPARRRLPGSVGQTPQTHEPIGSAAECIPAVGGKGQGIDWSAVRLKRGRNPTLPQVIQVDRSVISSGQARRQSEDRAMLQIMERLDSRCSSLPASMSQSAIAS